MAMTAQDIIQENVEMFFQKLGFDVSITVISDSTIRNTFLCHIQTKGDDQILIGQDGAHLAAIQHIIRGILYKKMQDPFLIVVDINKYLSQKKVFIEQEAEQAAQTALRDYIPITLRPMLSYERKIVHSFFAGHPHITTQSIGVGAGRRIVIQPTNGEEIAQHTL